MLGYDAYATNRQITNQADMTLPTGSESDLLADRQTLVRSFFIYKTDLIIHRVEHSFNIYFNNIIILLHVNNYRPRTAIP